MQIQSLLPIQYQTDKNNRLAFENTVKYSCGLSFKSAGDMFVKSSENIIQNTAKSDLIEKIISIFKNSAESLPEGLDVKTSPISNQVLSFTKNLKNGKKLIATKQFIHKNCKNYFYISLKEYKNNELSNAFAIDMDTLDIVKLKQQKGNIKFRDDDFIRVNADSTNYNNYSQKLSGYVDAIFSGGKKNTVTSIDVLKPKQATKNPFKISIDDLLDEDKILELPEEIPLKEIITEGKKSEKPIKTAVKKSHLNVKNELPAKKISQAEKLPKKAISEFKQKVKIEKPTTKGNNQIDWNAVQSASVEPIFIENLKAAKHTISKTPYGKLSSYLSDKLLSIEENLTKITVLLNDHRGNINKIKHIKSLYEPVEYCANRQKTINFKLANNKILSVIHTKNGEKFTRIIFKNSNGDETHFLIEDRHKVVSNLNKKKPWIVPTKFRYMTDEQIKASNIDKYIEFLDKEVPRYYTYLNENLH